MAFLQSEAKAMKKGKDKRASIMAMNGIVIKQRHLSIERDNKFALLSSIIQENQKAMFAFRSKPINFFFVFSCMQLFLGIKSIATAGPISHNCSDDVYYQNSTFATNLNQLISSLTSKAANQSFYNFHNWRGTRSHQRPLPVSWGYKLRTMQELPPNIKH
ncbi:hypothetical protein CKAN_01730200 [Cinnamomum micranthum f. kanehirae]|uniref:Uncharacterized protein n=1 Tax=Cinnamomum micranthum f. kanehirae TaxID=337451 RepID=A0A443PC21_9MAGN|nr:hypothetical protein CKAN_01730200 [Cinnamomum micranthum f. kanehirae]